MFNRPRRNLPVVPLNALRELARFEIPLGLFGREIAKLAPRSTSQLRQQTSSEYAHKLGDLVPLQPVFVEYTHIPPASAHAGSVSPGGGAQKPGWHLLLRQTAPPSQGQPQMAPIRAPDPSGVLETSALNCARAPTLTADPPHWQVMAEQ